MKNKTFISGIVAAASPVPLAMFTILWSWIWFFGIGLGVLNYDRIPDWIAVCSLLPLAVSPVLGVIGIVLNTIKIKEKLSWLGMVLSFVCLVENFLLIYGMGYIGSRY